MSISSMTSVAYQRRSDTPGVIPRSTESIAAATGEPADAGNAATTTLKVIATYIPTEVLTVYLAVVAGIQDPARWAAFWIFLAATPVVVWLVYAARVSSGGRPLPLPLPEWPVWEMFAATAAYAAWAFALPATPFAEFSWYSNAIAGIIVLATSTVLGLLAPLFVRQINAQRSQLPTPQP